MTTNSERAEYIRSIFRTFSALFKLFLPTRGDALRSAERLPLAIIFRAFGAYAPVRSLSPMMKCSGFFAARAQSSQSDRALLHVRPEQTPMLRSSSPQTRRSAATACERYCALSIRDA